MMYTIEQSLKYYIFFVNLNLNMYLKSSITEQKKFMEEQYLVGEEGKKQAQVIKYHMNNQFSDPRQIMTTGQITGQISKMTEEKKRIGTENLEKKKQLKKDEEKNNKGRLKYWYAYPKFDWW